uniref:U-box domain-containing protein n=1 Tax=Oryza brachyantha TaxID=4533 RepID=J3LDL2_ORYBR
MEAAAEVPSYFLCPISLEIMRDPVTLATGITYDRCSIEKWLFGDGGVGGGKGTCPVTRRQLAPAEREATPNHTLRRLIQAWSAEYLFDSVLDSPMSTSSPEEEALGVLYSLKPSQATLLRILDKNGGFLDTLASVLRRPSYRSRAYAILLLKAMTSAMSPERLMTVSSELVQEVVRVVADGVSSKAVKAALHVLCRLCPWGRNRVKAVEAGAVAVDGGERARARAREMLKANARVWKDSPCLQAHLKASYPS